MRAPAGSPAAQAVRPGPGIGSLRPGRGPGRSGASGANSDSCPVTDLDRLETVKATLTARPSEPLVTVRRLG